jgi:hypothetical protein
MKAGDVISVYSDINGKCKKGAKEFDGTKVFLGNGISELSRKDIFNGLPDLKYVTELCGRNKFLSVVQKAQNSEKAYFVTLYKNFHDFSWKK